MLIDAAGKGGQVFATLIELYDFVHQSLLGTLDRPGVVVILLGHLIHFVNDRLKRTTGIFL